MPITDPTKIIASIPAYKMDQIVGIVTGSLALPAWPGFGSFEFAETTVDTELGATTYPLGVWSPDGDTWFDLGSNYFNGTTDPFEGNLFAGLGAPIITSDGMLTIGGETGLPAFTALFKIALLARNDQGPLTPTGTHRILNYSSKLNYMKIFKEDVVSIDNGDSFEVHHALGYVPNVRCWISQDDNTLGDNLAITQQDSVFTLVDTENVTLLNNDFVTRFVHYRIYLDG